MMYFGKQGAFIREAYGRTGWAGFRAIRRPLAALCEIKMCRMVSVSSAKSVVQKNIISIKPVVQKITARANLWYLRHLRDNKLRSLRLLREKNHRASPSTPIRVIRERKNHRHGRVSAVRMSPPSGGNDGTATHFWGRNLDYEPIIYYLCVSALAANTIGVPLPAALSRPCKLWEIGPATKTETL
ncbi:MAG: hypothetical protein I3J02_00185 [Prevotella sp.]|nr:hypothetical protein [Prevotella sp.]